MKAERIQKLIALIEKRDRLMEMGIQEGWLVEDRGYFRLMQRKAGRTVQVQMVPKAEVDLYRARIDRYRQVRAISKAITKIESALDSVLAEVAA